MKKLFLVKQKSYDYDMKQSVIVVADSEEKARQLGIKELQDCMFYDKDNEHPIIVQEIDLTKEQIVESF